MGWVGGRGGCFFAVGGEVLGCWLTMDFLRQVHIEDMIARRSVLLHYNLRVLPFCSECNGICICIRGVDVRDS